MAAYVDRDTGYEVSVVTVFFLLITFWGDLFLKILFFKDNFMYSC